MLAWVGTVRVEPYTIREKAALSALVPALRRRLKLERRLDLGRLREAALSAALEGIPAPAFVVSAAGAIRIANSAGEALVQRKRTDVHQRLRESIAGRSTSFSVTPFSATGVPLHWLAIQRAEGAQVHPRVTLAAARWELTPRQIEVLELLAKGKPDKAIAMELGCTVGTAHLHVSAILARADVSSRAELIAKIWRRPQRLSEVVEVSGRARTDGTNPRCCRG
jgi:DNA-binding CsgD family transcriptional regulator